MPEKKMSASRRGTVVLANRIISADADKVVPCCLVISEGMIEGIYPGIPPFAGSKLLDYSRYAIAPVFCDYHLHLPFHESGKLLHIISTLARHGIYSVYEGGDRTGAGMAEKMRFAGSLQARVAGYALYKRDTYGRFIGKPVVDIPDAKRAIDALKQDGADYLKVVHSGIYDPEADRITKGGFSADMLGGIVDYAAECGLDVFCHANGRQAVAEAVHAGVSAVVHGLYVDDITLDLMAANNTVYIPTICAFQSLEKRVHSEAAAMNVRRVVELQKAAAYKAYERGVRVLPGSDAGPDFIPYGSSFIDELGLLLDAGIPYEQVIGFAAAAPIRTGAPADFLVLDGLNLQRIFRNGRQYHPK